MNIKHPVFLIALSCIIFSACQKIEPKPPAADTVMNAPLDGLTYEQNHLFNVGGDYFDENFTSDDGLGPVFVATSCGSCHNEDSRGQPSTELTRFGQDDTTGNKFLQFGGPQLQNHAIPGYTPETVPAGATSSIFIAPIAAGVGFLEAVPDTEIMAMADPNDANGDGISGIPNWNKVPYWVKLFPNAIEENGKHICRFGRKASVYSLFQQTVTALNQDMGITSTFMPQNPENYQQGENPVPDASPEISNSAINAIVFYLQALQVPVQRDQGDPDVIHGKEIFGQIGCGSCHRETLKTGYSPISALSNKEFHPYTDLLLHDMGPGLDDHYTEGSAQTYEWRTTPLWGLGLAPDAQGGQYYLMHDGRAHSIQDAILLHGGEAAQSATNYQNLSQSDKDALIKFLKSL